ncbi:hypothetical protein ACFRJ9_22355 [Paenarthrobacter sp. NPDC056912]|uniref:hypothetical protein n=1 Tax=Paenarthrobacter sp. NPDC056912 TaxID=3345965 RepID=UPI00366CD25D
MAGSAPVALAATMNSCPTRCSRLSAASSRSAAVGGLLDGAGDGGTEGVGACVVAGGDDDELVLDGKDDIPDDVGPAELGPAAPLPLEQPDATATSTPAVAMLAVRDANVWVLRMVNR